MTSATQTITSTRAAAAAPEWSAFRPDVEGLRAVAVALVVVYHASLPGVSAGYVGVDVFFVVSGFVISRLLLRERILTGRIRFVDFYARRARRILPAASLVTVATVVATFVVLGAYAGPSAADDASWTALFAANLHFADLGTSYLASEQPPSPLQHMWSLGVEEQFYLLWPLLLALGSLRAASSKAVLLRCAGLLGCLIAASYAYSIYLTPRHGAVAFFSPLTRAFELALGASVAVATPALGRLPGRFWSWLGLAGVGVVVSSAFFFDARTTWPGAAVLVPTAATALVLVAGGVRQRSALNRLLGCAPLRWLGSRSYSLYLWHWPVLILAAERLGQPVLPLRRSAPLLCVAVLLAELSYRLLENPIRSSPAVRARPRLSVAAGLAGSLVVFVAMRSIAN